MRLVRSIFQILVAVLGWVLFALGWWYAASRAPLHSANMMWLLWLALAAAVTLLVTQAWVRHNIAIYRKHGPREQVRATVYDYSRDVQGTPVDADFSALKTARFVVIAKFEDSEPKKVYSAGSTDVSLTEGAACNL